MTNTSFHIDDINSLPEALFRMAEKHADHPAQWYRTDEGYRSVSYTRMVRRIQHIASGFIRAGIQAGDRVALLMENRPEWAVLDYAILSIGAVTVPLYCSYRAADIAHVLNDAEAAVVLTSGGKLLQNILASVAQCPTVQYIYAIDCGDDARDANNDANNDGSNNGSNKVIPLSSLESGSFEELELTQRLIALNRDTLATLVYTSGTTAHPKGVMLTHGNIITNLESVPAALPLTTGRGADCFLSFLPLAHMLERTGSHFVPYSFGLSVAFAERPDTVAKNMQEAHPSIMIVVPRMLEVMRSRILAQISKQSVFKQKLFHAYLNHAIKKNPGLFTRSLLRLLDRLVGRKVRQGFGGQLRVFICGGAPLSPEVAEFFEALGLPVMVGYGLTESAPLLAVNLMSARRLGSVGQAAKGVELGIAEDGEILARGSNIMQGYWHDEASTRSVLIDGWLHTGDLGALSSDAYLTITGRKKEIIVNSGGENIAPERVEGMLLVDESIDQVIVFGDQKAYLVALVVPNQNACVVWAQQQGLPATDWQHLCESAILKKHLQNTINTMLKPLSAFEQIRRIHVLTDAFSIESDMLTPTMKMKRRIIYSKYAETIAALYA